MSKYRDIGVVLAFLVNSNSFSVRRHSESEEQVYWTFYMKSHIMNINKEMLEE